jgi:hypothetical protein
MGIQITNAPVAPSMSYDRVHVTALRIIQEIYYDDNQYPKYRVEVEYRLYGVAGGQRYYQIGDVKHVVIPDYIPVAQAALMDGDPTMLAALHGIEQAVAVILSQEGGLNTTLT